MNLKDTISAVAKEWWPDSLMAAGAASVSAGAGLVYAPAGWIVAGVFLIAAGVLGSRR